MSHMNWTEGLAQRWHHWRGSEAADEGLVYAGTARERRGRHGRRHGRRHGWFGFGGPFGGNPFGGHPFARRGRAKRGDVRAAILALLAEAPRNGYQVMQELEQRSGGAWRPSPGSVYPAFQQLEDEGLIRGEEGAGGKTYRLTDAGRAEAERVRAGEPPWEALSEEEDDSRRALFDQMRQTGMASFQILHAGDPAQIAAAEKVLAEARKALYRILAEDAPKRGK
jgi:DNA-binding PadR family transcriptional regulator